MRLLPLLLVSAFLGCSAVPAPRSETDYAAAMLARPAPDPVAVHHQEKAVPRDPEPDPQVAAPAPHVLRELARDESALDEFLTKPFTALDMADLATLRSEEVVAARSDLEAARTGYRQSADLDDLATLYRAWSKTLDTRVGPQRHRRPTAVIAPSPNISALSGEWVDRTVDLAREKLRAAELAVAAEAHRVHAAVAYWAESRRVVAEDLRMVEGLLAVLKARLEAGQTDQAGYLTFSATVSQRRTDLAVLEEQAPVLRARLNRLLARPERAVVNLDLVAGRATPGSVAPDAVVGRALSESPSTRMATIRSERAAIAVRLAETMTLPRFDVGSARFERERTGEAGVDRGPVFPDPGKMIMPRSDFGVREAQVTEMRAAAVALEAAARDARGRTASAVRNALFSLTSAEKRLTTLTKDVVPLAERALRATRGAYEGNRSGYLDLLEAARRLLKARLDRAGATRDVSVARADLLVAAGFDPGKEDD